MRLRLFCALLAFVVLVPSTAAVAQESTELPPDVLDALGVTLEELLATEPNPAWDNLGLFSPDAQRVMAVAGQPADFITYGFGDDPNGTPIINPPGLTPTEFGTLLWELPADWAPPAEGMGDAMAFAQTQGSQLAPGDTVLFAWMEMDSDYEFASGLTLNEGFPLTIPGIPVWNSTFAGDTWEGANLIPNAVFDGTTLTLDVKMFQPPQNFPLVDLAAFYYRSGNVMAMAISADGLAAQIEAAAQQSTAAPSASAGETRDLLYRGGSSYFLAQDPLEELAQVLIGSYSHAAVAALFTPGFIYRLTVRLLTLPPALRAELILLVGSLIDGPDEEESEDTPQEAPLDAAVPADDAQAEDSEVQVDASGSASTATDDESNSILILGLIILGILLSLGGLWLAIISPRRKRRPPEKSTVSDPRTYTLEPGTEEDEEEEDDDPRDTPPPTIFGEEIDDSGACDWELNFNSGGNWKVLREAAPGTLVCCVYDVEIESKTLFHDEVASFRQDVRPERLYIPDLASSTTGMNYLSSSSTRSGPAGRQDWQHGYGNPTDQTELGDPSSFWQQGQGEERPELTAQMAHIELTRVRVTLDSGCAGHENTYNVSSDGGVSVMSTHECTNDNPGPACPVELNAYGAHAGLAFGDLTLKFIEATGTDIDELERFASALTDMTSEELERAGNPPIPVIGRWDGHDHDVRDRMTYENTEDDTGHPIKTGDEWETWFVTLSVHFAGQLVPVSVWETTERVSTHIQAGFEWNLTLTGEMEKKPCDPGPCAGNHSELACHTQPRFVLGLSGNDNTLDVDGKTFDLARPVFAPPSGLSIPTTTTFWDASPSIPIGMP